MTSEDQDQQCEVMNAEKCSFHYKWIINDYSAIELDGKNRKTISFGIPCLFTNGSLQLSRSYSATGIRTGRITVSLKCHSRKMALACDVVVVDSNGRNYEVVESDKGERWRYNSITFIHEFGDEKFIWDPLIIRCAIRIINPVFKALNEPKTEERVGDSFNHLFSSGRYSDITLSVGAREFNVHKLILASQSPLFAAMFNEVLAEDLTTNIDVTDIDEITMNCLLHYLYTGQLPRIHDSSLIGKLLDAAHKYELPGLTAACASYLHGDLHTHNAADLLIFADRYKLMDLKDCILTFMVDKRKEVMQTYGYKNMEEYQPHLLLEIMTRFWKICD